MKMGNSIFWGLVLVVVGLGFILRVFFDINLLRVLIALGFIAFGIILLMGRSARFVNAHGPGDTVFSEQHHQQIPRNGAEYNTFFGKSVYEIGGSENWTDKRVRIEINTVFGSTIVKVPRNVNLKVKATSAFAAASMPDHSSVAFGTSKYQSESGIEDVPLLYIDANVVFGSLSIQYTD